MKKRWIKRTGIGLLIIAVMVAVAGVIELCRPGTVMCPLRQVAEKIGLDIPLPELTPEQEAKAKSTAATWKLELLNEFPNLQVVPREVPEQENGYLQLYHLKDKAQTANGLRDLFQAWKGIDFEIARRELEANPDWVQQVEGIASLTQRSSMNLPETLDAWPDGRSCKLAIDTMMLKSRLAARDRNEAESLRCMIVAGNLIDHLQDIETPCYYTETITILLHLSRCRFIIDEILPNLGPSADLALWRKQLKRYTPTPQRLAAVTRGEWHIAADHLTLPNFISDHQRRALIDPRAAARTWSRCLLLCSQKLQSISLQDMEQLDKMVLAELSREERERAEELDMFFGFWNRGFIRAARLHARALAAIDLLALERSRSNLQDSDSSKVTPDPLTQQPFLLDATARTLTLPGDFPDYSDDPLKLPW